MLDDEKYVDPESVTTEETTTEDDGKPLSKSDAEGWARTGTALQMLSSLLTLDQIRATVTGSKPFMREEALKPVLMALANAAHLCNGMSEAVAGEIGVESEVKKMDEQYGKVKDVTDIIGQIVKGVPATGDIKL